MAPAPELHPKPRATTTSPRQQRKPRKQRVTKKELEEMKKLRVQIAWQVFMRECIKQLGPNLTSKLLVDSSNNSIVREVYNEEMDGYLLKTFRWKELFTDKVEETVLAIPHVDDRLVRREPVEECDRKMSIGRQKKIKLVDLTMSDD